MLLFCTEGHIEVVVDYNVHQVVVCTTAQIIKTSSVFKIEIRSLATLLHLVTTKQN
jgi:hypothetical protein